jgi:hypothetical protein
VVSRKPALSVAEGDLQLFFPASLPGHRNDFLASCSVSPQTLQKKEADLSPFSSSPSSFSRISNAIAPDIPRLADHFPSLLHNHLQAFSTAPRHQNENVSITSNLSRENILGGFGS